MINNKIGEKIWIPASARHLLFYLNPNWIEKNNDIVRATQGRYNRQYKVHNKTDLVLKGIKYYLFIPFLLNNGTRYICHTNNKLIIEQHNIAFT